MQKTRFLHSLGDAWFDRNHTELGKRDPVTDLIEQDESPHGARNRLRQRLATIKARGQVWLRHSA